MEWLTDNSIANMKGADFLLFYVTMVIALLILGRMYIRSADSTAREMPLSLPSKPDPYELAYLRGGVREVIRLAVFRLIQTRTLVIRDKDRKIGHARRTTEPPGLSDMERIVFKELATPQTMPDICKGLYSRIKETCSSLEQRLSNNRLLAPPAVIDRARMVKLALCSIIFLLGGYKLVIALSRGRTNVIFLIIVAVIGVILTFKVSRVPWLSKRGSQYLKGFQKDLRNREDTTGPESGIESPDLALMVALFGLTVLAGTAYAEYANVLELPRSPSGDSTTGGCGSGCGGGSSSDGGGSDGGGGGCGGCGGGD